ncbi:shikimate 3-dehydrogenase [Aureococcus anophagefferens]|nr:shikimate 3-dehydrogenase [Aureococcus anophagefferens]
MAMATKLACAALCIAVASGFAPSRPGGAAPAARRDGRAAVAVAAAVESLSLSPIAKVGGVVRLPGSKSLSNRALLIAALCEGETTPLVIEITDELISQPYVQLTVDLMAKFGVVVDIDGAHRSLTAAPRKSTRTRASPTRPTSSRATRRRRPTFAAAAMTGGDLTVVGCGSSTQGDVRFAEVLRDMGAPVTLHPTNITVAAATPNLKGIDVDCLDIPDAAMTPRRALPPGRRRSATSAPGASRRRSA